MSNNAHDNVSRAPILAVLAIVVTWSAGTSDFALEEPNGFSTVVAGAVHKCGLDAVGGVKCWGYNFYGQIGDGTTTARPTPVDVSGLGIGIVAIKGGNSHTCVITKAGGVKCWGYNFYGQLGDGTTAQRLTPVEVQGLADGVIDLAAGLFHTCALTSTGKVKCWGYNNDQELGDNTTINRAAPVDVTGLEHGVISISAEGLHTCAKLAAGGVRCWGHDSAKWESAPPRPG
jgi:alpha-tubulin suppressor-like RCC1 family protein